MSTSGGYGGKTIVVTTAAVGAFVATVGAVFAYTNSEEYQSSSSSSSSSSSNWKRKNPRLVFNDLFVRDE